MSGREYEDEYEDELDRMRAQRKREEATETEIPFPPEPSGSPVQFDRMVQPNSTARSVRKGSVSRKRMMILK